MKKLFLLPLIASGLAYAAPENDQQRITERLTDQNIPTRENDPLAQSAPAQQAPQVPAKQSEAPTVTLEQLATRPDLVTRALLPAVRSENTEVVKMVYPLYKDVSEQYKVPHLDEWAQAILAHYAGDYGTSIDLYRKVISALPNLLPARFQLATVLFQNNELEAAEDQFQKLRSEQALHPQSKEVIQQYLDAIAQRDKWNFSAGVTYLNDPNINNAPKSGTRIGNWQAPESESAEGIGFNLGVGKRWSWGNGFYHKASSYLNGKYYWDNKKYNEFSGRFSFGLGFKNAKSDISISPFVEQVLYAGGTKQSDTLHRFSFSKGAVLNWSYWLSPQWQLSNEFEYGNQHYKTRKHLNGNYGYLSSTLTYLASVKQYWFVGVDIYKNNTRDKDDSFLRSGGRIGWGQEWNWGLSTRLSLNYAQRNYRGPMPIFNITQRNKEYGISASIWHRAVHYLGITPRLTWSYQKVKSNHAFYNYDKNRVFIELSKQF